MLKPLHINQAMLSCVHCSSQLLSTAARTPRALPPALWCTLVRHRQGTAAACTAAGAASAGASAIEAATATYITTSEPALQHLAAALADDRQAGDCICLFGAVGAGKSVFSRAYIRAAVGDPDLTVPSPTFLLQQIYDECEGPPIHHFDLYRLMGGRTDLQRLNLGASFEQSVSLVEWAERLREAHLLPSSRLDVHIEALDMENRGARQCLHQQRDMQESSTSQEAGWEDSTDADAGTHDPYTDQRWRRVQLQAHGMRWQHCLQHIRLALAHNEQMLGTS